MCFLTSCLLHFNPTHNQETMQLLSVPSIFLACVLLIAGVDGRCPRVNGKVYLVTYTLPGVAPFYSLLTLLPGGTFTNIASGASSLTKNTYSDIVGNYYCVNARTLKLAGTAFFYPNANSTSVGPNGAIGLFTYEYTFESDARRLSGRSLLTYYLAGSNPYDPQNTPTLVGTYADNHGILLEVPGAN